MNTVPNTILWNIPALHIKYSDRGKEAPLAGSLTIKGKRVDAPDLALCCQQKQQGQEHIWRDTQISLGLD